MANVFFGRSSTIGELQIDETNTSADSDSIRRRLGRIQQNYDQLDLILSDIESRLTDDKISRIIGKEAVAATNSMMEPESQIEESHIEESANPRKPR